MMKRVFSTLAALCVGAALAGCSSPAQNTAFQPPSTWKATPGMFGRLQMWMTGSDTQSRQILMLIRGDKNMSTADLSASSPVGGNKNVSDVKRDTITICGTQPADHFTGKGQSTTNGNAHVVEAIEGVTTTIADSKYLVLYIRPIAVKPDAQAENALRSICPKA